jgi:hypothetical protein
MPLVQSRTRPIFLGNDLVKLRYFVSGIRPEVSGLSEIRPISGQAKLPSPDIGPDRGHPKQTSVRAASVRVSWSPAASRELRRNLRPRVATRCKWARIEALLRNRAFVVEYASARERWRNGIPAVFPPGTYWLQRFASVPVRET